MSPGQIPTARTDERRFTYRSPRRFWWRYLPAVIGVLFVYYILWRYEIQPFSVPGFWLLIVLVFLDFGVTAMLRRAAPLAFQVKDGSMTIEWSQHTATEALKSLAISRMPSRLLTSGTIVRAGEKSFTVFVDLDGYDELISIIDRQVRESPCGQ